MESSTSSSRSHRLGKLCLLHADRSPPFLSGSQIHVPGGIRVRSTIALGSSLSDSYNNDCKWISEVSSIWDEAVRSSRVYP